MGLWKLWWKWASPLRPACARTRTFMWMLAVLVGFCVRADLLGVTSIVRALGLQPACYDRILDFFHSSAVNLGALTRTWTALVLKMHPALLRFKGRLVLVADGIKVPKSGKKMPAVKKLHQESESNNKPEFIMGHSCQAVAILVQGLASVAAIPLVARINEGLVFTNRDKRTLLDKFRLPDPGGNEHGTLLRVREVHEEPWHRFREEETLFRHSKRTQGTASLPKNAPLSLNRC